MCIFSFLQSEINWTAMVAVGSFTASIVALWNANRAIKRSEASQKNQFKKEYYWKLKEIQEELLEYIQLLNDVRSVGVVNGLDNFKKFTNYYEARTRTIILIYFKEVYPIFQAMIYKLSDIVEDELESNKSDYDNLEKKFWFELRKIIDKYKP